MCENLLSHSLGSYFLQISLQLLFVNLTPLQACIRFGSERDGRHEMQKSRLAQKLFAGLMPTSQCKHFFCPPDIYERSL